MQERYLGDSHDFLKYALLRHLSCELGLRLGVNWYLTQPEHVDRPGNNDGEKRHHLNGSAWRSTDPALFDTIGAFGDPAARLLKNVATWGLLPSGTTYFAEEVATTDRAAWHSRALDALSGTDLVFLDPDNGFEVASMSARTKPKYALFDEAQAYFDAGKVVVSIQFARQCDPVARAQAVRSSLVKLCGDGALLPVVRGRVAPNILFLTLAPSELTDVLSEALTSFCGKCAKADLIP